LNVAAAVDVETGVQMTVVVAVAGDVEREAQLTAVAAPSLWYRLLRAGVADLGGAMEVVEVRDVDLGEEAVVAPYRRRSSREPLC
jgi:hypothetical protein